MLAGLQGFQEGFRFGRELMGDSPEDRAARSALLAAQEKSAAADRKQLWAMDKFGQEMELRKQQLAETQGYHKTLNDNAQHSYGLQKDRLDFEKDRYNAGAKQRDLVVKKLQQDVGQEQEDAAYRQASQQNLGDFQAVINGTASPEQVERAKRFFPMVTQDATAASAALRAVAQKSAAFLQRGDTESADAVWATPEGQAAMNAGYGPLFSRRVGQTDYDGLHVVTGARAVGVTRSPDGQRLGFKIETTQEPTPEFRAKIEQQIGAASSEEERNGLRELLKPHTYVADMTEGRVPVSQGGQTKYFTKEDFANGVQLLDHIGEWQRQNPDQVEELQTLFMGAASGRNAAQGMERQQIEMDKLLQRRLSQADQTLRREAQAWKQSNKGGGANATMEKKIAGLRGAIGRMVPGPDEENQGALKERLGRLQARAEDIIREKNGDISITDAMKQAQAETPVPRSSEEIHGSVADLIGGGGQGSQVQDPNEGRIAIGPDGKRYVKREGKFWEVE